MRLLYYSLLCLLYLTEIGIYLARGCILITDRVGVIAENQRETYDMKKCWKIQVPPDSYLKISITDLNFQTQECRFAQLKINVEATNESISICSENKLELPKVLTVLSDVQISTSLRAQELVIRRPDWNLSQYRDTKNIEPVNFRISYTRANIICAQNNHFQCSEDSCVHKYQVCNGVKECENGKDEENCATGLAAVSGVYVTLQNGVKWLKERRSLPFRWGENTHRAITALYLSGEVQFRENNLEEDLIEKELELKMLAALLRNSTDLLQASELSMFVNALIVTCHNPRQFYGYDLLQILGDRVVNTITPFPGASLTLCNANWTLPEHTIRNLLKLLHEESEYPFIQDIQATAVMALACIRKKASSLEKIENATETYNAMIEKFISGQLSDGSFGNVYTTAIITQALLSSGQESNSRWNVTATAKYLMSQLHVPSDILATCLVLPVLNDKSLVDLSDVNCSRSRKTRRDAIVDLTNKLGKKVKIQYTLYIGDLKDVVHTIYLRVPEKSTAYDVMRLAENNDVKYKFSHRYVGTHLYVYNIAGIFNDPEALKFWLLYIADPRNGGEANHFTKSPDKLMVTDGQHLIMWYRTVPMSKKQDDKTKEETEDKTDNEAEDKAKDETEVKVKNKTEDEIEGKEQKTDIFSQWMLRNDEEKIAI